MGDVSAKRADSLCVSPLVNDSGSDESWFRLVSLPCLSSDESSELGLTDDSLDGNDAGG